MPAPCPHTRADRVENDAVKAGRFAWCMPAVPELGRDIVQRPAAQPQRCLVAAPRLLERADHHPFSLHERCQLLPDQPGFAAHIPPPLARIGVTSNGNALRRDVLDDQPAGTIVVQARQIGLGGQLGCRSQAAMNPGLEARISERVPDRFFVGTAHAEPERRPRLQRRQKLEPAHLGCGNARRHRQLIPQPGGKEHPRVGIDGAFSQPALQSLGPSGPVGRITNRHQTVGPQPRARPRPWQRR